MPISCNVEVQTTAGPVLDIYTAFRINEDMMLDLIYVNDIGPILEMNEAEAAWFGKNGWTTWLAD